MEPLLLLPVVIEDALLPQFDKHSATDAMKTKIKAMGSMCQFPIPFRGALFGRILGVMMNAQAHLSMETSGAALDMARMCHRWGISDPDGWDDPRTFPVQKLGSSCRVHSKPFLVVSSFVM